MHEPAKRRTGETARKPVRHFHDLDVYQNPLAVGLRVYERGKKFPAEERYVNVKMWSFPVSPFRRLADSF